MNRWTIICKYSRDENNWKRSDLSYAAAVAVIDTLIQEGLLEGDKGYWDKQRKEGRTAWFCPTPSLTQLFQNKDKVAATKEELEQDKELIQLKDKDKHTVSFVHSSLTIGMETALKEINSSNQQHCFNLKVLEGTELSSSLLSLFSDWDSTSNSSESHSIYTVTHGKIYNLSASSFSNLRAFIEFVTAYELAPTSLEPLTFQLDRLMRYKRVFNRSSFEKGGRFFCPLQSIPKSFRRFITIDGQPTVTLDYSGMHIRMLYDRLGEKLEGDAYSTELHWKDSDMLRDALKTALLTMLNAKTEAAAARSMAKEMKDGDLVLQYGTKPTHLIAALKHRHPIIQQFFCSDAGIDLMREESNLSERIMLAFSRANKPLLNIHDGNLCKAEDKDMLKELMLSVYFDVYRNDAVIKEE